MNRYWKYDEFYESWNLYFTQFYDDEKFISFARSEYNDDWFEITFQKENITTNEMLEAETIEEAKEECEYKIKKYIQDQISYYENMLEKFEEE